MKTAIIYSSTHGTTEKVALEIQNKLGSERCNLFNLKVNDKVDLSGYSQVVIGGSIHAGMIQGRIKDFCNKNMVSLLDKDLALYLSCMHEGEEAKKQFEMNYPELLRNHARIKKLTGGEFLFEKMNFFQKAIVRKVSGVKQTQSKMDQKAIDDMVNELQNI